MIHVNGVSTKTTALRDGKTVATPAANHLSRTPLAGTPIDVTIFVACYNEEENIVETLDTVVAAMREVGCTYEIIVVDDASRDRSVAVVRAYQERHPSVPVLLHENPVNRGLARNFVEAAFLGRGKYYKLVCGDNVEPRERLVQILRQMGRADLIIPYHTTCEGKSWFRSLISKLYTRLVNLISGYSLRYYNGMALYHRYHVMRWHSHTLGFGFQADLVTRLLDEGATYQEVFAPVRERVKGNSKAITFRNVISVAHTFFEIGCRRLRRFLFKV